MAFFAKRILWTVPILWGVLTLVFLLLHMVPGDPVDIMLGENAVPADREQMRQELGLDRPLAEQYARYLGRAAVGDLGRSLHSRDPVTLLIAERLPATVELMLGAMAIALTLAFPLGIVAALNHGRWADQAAGTFAVIGVAMPNFWLGPMLILLFAIRLDWLPVNERGGFTHLILPALTLGMGMAALLSRMTRASLVAVLGEDFIRSARAKGLREPRVVFVHALRNALIPVITVIGIQIGALLSGAIITESIFDWPGLGSLLLEGIRSRDYPLVQGCVLSIATSYVLVNLLTDLVYGWVDPRIRRP
jgi:peptide/nickel transport system permease protein